MLLQTVDVFEATIVMREPRIGEAFIMLHESGNDHDRHAPTGNGSLSSRRPGDVVGHLLHVIALLTLFGVRTRGLRAGGASLLWPPNWTLCKMSRRRDGGGKKLVWPARLPCEEAVRNSTATSGRSP